MEGKQCGEKVREHSFKGIDWEFIYKIIKDTLIDT
jgi:hypothetical protein